MPKKSKPIDYAEPFTAAKAAAIVNELKLFTAKIDEFRQVAETTQDKSLAVHNTKSLDRGITGLVAFVKAVETSLRAQRLGTPIAPGDVKPRSPAAAKKLKVAERKPGYKHS